MLTGGAGMVLVRTSTGMCILDMFSGSPRELDLAKEMVFSSLFGTNFDSAFIESHLASRARARRN